MLKQVYEMKVQILNNNCEVVWSYDIAAPVDQSGDSWTNEKHQIMAGVVFSLRRALEQAEVFPSDPEWKWPFSICPNSENTFQKIGQKVGNDSNLLIVFYVQIMPDDFVMQLHRF